MKEKKQNEELQSRREFFKEATRKTLPLFVLAAMGTGLLSSCEKELFSNGCSCSGSCSGSCDDGCTNNCDSLCGGDCWAYCQSVARSGY